MAASYTHEAMQELIRGNAARYYSEFTAMNEKLSRLALQTADMLTASGHKALPKVPSTAAYDGTHRTPLPHKTVATLAGLGWIGKCALLVTREYGSAIRLAVVLTDAPLDCGVPITESSCDEGCAVCRSVCPGKAVKGKNWHRGLEREAFYDAFACHEAARKRAERTLGINETICGLCISHCPFTRRALAY